MSTTIIATDSKAQSVNLAKLRSQAFLKEQGLEVAQKVKAVKAVETKSQAARRKRKKEEMFKQAKAAARVTKANKKKKEFDVNEFNQKQMMKDDGIIGVKGGSALSAIAIDDDEDAENYGGLGSSGTNIVSTQGKDDLFFEGARSPGYEHLSWMHSGAKVEQLIRPTYSHKAASEATKEPEYEGWHLANSGSGYRELDLIDSLGGIAAWPCPQFNAGHLAPRMMRGTWRRCRATGMGPNQIPGCDQLVMVENAFQQAMIASQPNSFYSHKEWDHVMAQNFDEEELLEIELRSALKNGGY
jgi:hypothetical protein